MTTDSLDEIEANLEMLVKVRSILPANISQATKKRLDYLICLLEDRAFQCLLLLHRDVDDDSKNRSVSSGMGSIDHQLTDRPITPHLESEQTESSGVVLAVPIETSTPSKEVCLTPSEYEALGFSLIALQCEDEHKENAKTNSTSIFINDIRNNSLASRSGQLDDGDQLLAINGAPVTHIMNHSQVATLMHSRTPSGRLRLTVAPNSKATVVTPSVVKARLAKTQEEEEEYSYL